MFYTAIRHIPRLFGSRNAWGIPDLLLEYQAREVRLPFLMWGEKRQHEEHLGTYAFYCEDKKFTGLINTPDKVYLSGCEIFCECNFSSESTQPRAISLWYIFWKRQISRIWQASRKQIIVDLHVDESLADINMYGVPHGWGAYSTRGKAGQEDLLDIQYVRACERCGDDPEIFIVYSGGVHIQQYCVERGWFWFPEWRQRVYGR